MNDILGTWQYDRIWATELGCSVNDLQADKAGWLVDETVSLGDDWSGAVAVSTRDGFVIGVAEVTKGRVRIVWTGL